MSKPIKNLQGHVVGLVTLRAENGVRGIVLSQYPRHKPQGEFITTRQDGLCRPPGQLVCIVFDFRRHHGRCLLVELLAKIERAWQRP